MLLTLTTTARPATDLGYLLGKNPARTQSFDLPFGKAHVFYPEATAERCTAALLVEVDAVGLVRGGNHDDNAPLAEYVNDRPYAASSFLSVALSRVFQAALGGRSRDRQELADTPIPLVATIAALPCRGGEPVLRGLFEPLGYEVELQRLPLDETFPAWGPSRFFDLTLRGTLRLHELLGHLYVLVPVLDDQKHYWVGDDEVDKLLRHGEGWLEAHPARDLIVRRSLKHRPSLVKDALHLLDGADPESVDEPDADPEVPPRHRTEEAVEGPLRLNDVRLGVVHDVLRELDCKTVVDLGCGEGKLALRLARDKRFERVLAVDVSMRTLEKALHRLDPDRVPGKVLERVQVIQGAANYRDARLRGLDAAVMVEVIEHIDAERLPAVEHVVFADARPRVVVVTTPNVEFNARFEALVDGKLRHPDHRFEWTRAAFEAWARGVADRHGYRVEFRPVGEVDPDLGPPTQMGVFQR